MGALYYVYTYIQYSIEHPHSQMRATIRIHTYRVTHRVAYREETIEACFLHVRVQVRKRKTFRLPYFHYCLLFREYFYFIIPYFLLRRIGIYRTNTPSSTIYTLTRTRYSEDTLLSSFHTNNANDASVKSNDT